MGTQYTNDNGLGDCIVGQATRVGYNFCSSLGAETAYKPSPTVTPIIKSNPQQVLTATAPVIPWGQPVSRAGLRAPGAGKGGDKKFN